MSWARAIFARTPFAAGAGTESATLPGQQELPPPIPGGTAKWTYTPNPPLGWARRGWAGGASPPTYPGGGVSIRPVPEAGVMQVTAWWPDATVLQIIREHSDGTLWPVRGGNPLFVTRPTRRNYALNPSLEVGLHGYVADAGNPTLARVTGGSAARGGAYLAATIAAAGPVGVTVPTSIPSTPDVTIGVDLRFSARPSAVTVQITWTDLAGVPLPASTAALTTDQINQSVDQFARQVVKLSTPAGAVTPTVKVIAAGMPAGGVMALDGFTVERYSTAGSFFDGATYGGTWLGPAGLSASILAPLLNFADGEAPLDIPLRYRVVNPASTGGTMTSQLATLLSGGRTWLTHPSRTDRPLVVQVGAVPKRTRESPRGVFYPLGATYPIIVSSSQRRAPTGELSLGALSFAERDELLAVFADLQPVYLRPPAEFGYGTGMWLSLGDLDEDPGDRRAYQGTRILTAPFHEVAAPSELAV
ncbi:hypothetical protein [Amycolatopsis sp. CA-230715]|uniref:hypothetical protein n=1 Tax=Amycolatopsis sp. CA-230715 TaxID=2745196 RepID=UPI001C02AF24|nr:hypothetical protein [Amycolatopsis sp. CA-230715]QWF78697.1 hypothetical protein HUW46_02095 [Amycolatopsis sp. CA-230715]